MVRVSDDRKFIWLSSDAMVEDVFQCKLQEVAQVHGTPVEVATTYGDGSGAKYEGELYLEYSADGKFEYSADSTVQ